MKIVEIPASDIKNIEVIDPINVSESVNKPKEKGCSTCKKGLNSTHWSMIVLSSYILFASIYGTIKLFKDIIALF